MLTISPAGFSPGAGLGAPIFTGTTPYLQPSGLGSSVQFGTMIAVVDPIVTTFVVKTNDAVPVPVDGVTIRAFTYPGDVLVAGGSTGAGADPAGTLTLMLDGSADPGTPYIVRLFKDGHLFEPGPTLLFNVLDPVVAPATNVFDFKTILPELLTSTDPDMCRITGVLTDVSLRPLQKRVVRFIPCLHYPENNPRFSAHYLGNPTLLRQNILAAPVEAITDQYGRIDVELPRGGWYDAHLHGFEHPISIAETIAVPDEPGYRLHELLWPYVTEVVYDTDPVSVAVGDSVEVGMVVSVSNQQEPSTEVVSRLLAFSSGDETVAIIELRNDGVLLVTGVEAGSTTLEVERVADTFAPRRPTISALIVTPPVVNVT